MTASTITAPTTTHGKERLIGLRPLLRKDATEWLRGRRAWVVLVSVTIIMGLTAASAWINTTLQGAFPEEGVDIEPVSLVPLDNLAAAIGFPAFVFATMLVVAGLIVGERSGGTLSWVASKPVSRGAIVVSKWASATGMLAITAVAVPLVVTALVVVALYGTPDPIVVIGLGIGMVASVAYFAAVTLVLGTVLPGQAGIVAAAFVVWSLPTLVGLLPAPASQLEPSAILAWFTGFASGADVGILTPISFVAFTAALLALAVRRVGRMEL